MEHLRRIGHNPVIVTNDGADTPAVMSSFSKFLSMKVDGAARLLQQGLSRHHTRSVRFGIEGVSERLRKAVGKPITDARLASVVDEMFKRGIGVTLFFIAGLPGEAEEDWLMLRELINRFRQMSKGCVMCTFHAFIPQPATPLCVLPLQDTYWEHFEEFRRWFFHGPGFTRRVQMIAPAQYAGRLKRACEAMAATEQELRRGWFGTDNRNWRVKYLAGPERLRAIARTYAQHLGLSIPGPDAPEVK